MVERPLRIAYRIPTTVLRNAYLRTIPCLLSTMTSFWSERLSMSESHIVYFLIVSKVSEKPRISWILTLMKLCSSSFTVLLIGSMIGSTFNQRHPLKNMEQPISRFTQYSTILNDMVCSPSLMGLDHRMIRSCTSIGFAMPTRTMHAITVSMHHLYYRPHM